MVLLLEDWILKLGMVGFIDFTHKLINVDESIKPDYCVDSLVSKALDKYRSMLNDVVGTN